MDKFSRTVSDTTNQNAGINFTGDNVGVNLGVSDTHTSYEEVGSQLLMEHTESQTNTDEYTISKKTEITGDPDGARFVIWDTLDEISLVRNSDEALVRSDKVYHSDTYLRYSCPEGGCGTE